MNTFGPGCVKTHRFQKSQIYLPLKQKSIFIFMLHMGQHGNNLHVVALASHFQNPLFVFTQPRPEAMGWTPPPLTGI